MDKMAGRDNMPSPSQRFESERHGRKEERSRSRAPNVTQQPSRMAYSSYHPALSTTDLQTQRYIPSSASQVNLNDEEQMSKTHKSRKNINVPKLTIRNSPDPEDSGPRTANPTTPSSSFVSKFGRGRSRTKGTASPTSAYPATPPVNSFFTQQQLTQPNQPYQPSQPEVGIARHGSESTAAQLERPGTRSSSSDGRISSKFKASKSALQVKSKAAWGIFKGKDNSKLPVPAKPLGPDVFGMPLEEATLKTRVLKERVPGADAAGFWLPAVAYRCISYLNVYGPREIGLYRVPGSTAAVDELRSDFQQNIDVDLFQNRPNDIATVASMLKYYVRVLPEPIVSPEVLSRIYERCKDSTNSSTPPRAFVDEISKLPPFNYYFLHALTNHLSNVNLASDVNKMTLSNLAMIFCSTLRIDRYVFNWLVGNWADCWGGCRAEDEFENAPFRLSIDGKTTAVQHVGLGIEARDGRDNVFGNENHRKMSERVTPETRKANRSSRIYESPLQLSQNNNQESERGRKRGSRDMGWPSPNSSRSKRMSADSTNSLDTQTAFSKPISPKHDTMDAGETLRNFKLDARSRRSVDYTTLMAMANQSPHTTPPLATPQFDPSRYNPVNSSRYRDQMPPPSRRAQNKGPGLDMDTGSSSSSIGRRTPSTPNERRQSVHGVDLLPPMSPMSPLMAGSGGNYRVG